MTATITVTDYNHTATWTIDRDTIPHLALIAGVTETYVRCYTCDGTDLSQGLFLGGGTATCYGCAVKYSEEGLDSTLVLTDAQEATAAEWAAAGIGAN